MHTFSVKDPVQHINGGPKMNIESVNGDMVTCVWFVGGHFKREVFPAPMLKCYIAPPTFRLARFSKGFSRG